MGRGGVSDMGLEGVEICGSFLRVPAIQKSRSASMHSTRAPLVSAGISLPAPVPWFCLFFFFLSGWCFREKSKTEPLEELSERWDRAENTLTRSFRRVSFNSLLKDLIFIVFWEWWKKILLYSKSIFLIGSIYMNLGFFFLIQSENLCSLVGMFRAFTSNVIFVWFGLSLSSWYLLSFCHISSLFSNLLFFSCLLLACVFFMI